MARLTLYEALAGTTLGFGVVQDPPEHINYRIQLVQAMELFFIGHEFSHAIAEERFAWAQGILEPEHQLRLELFCDQMGLQLSRNADVAEDNFLAFCGCGALAVFRAAQAVERVRDSVRDARPVTQDSRGSTHPCPADRIEALKSHLVATTDEDQRACVQEFVEEFDRITHAATELAAELIAEAWEARPGDSTESPVKR